MLVNGFQVGELIPPDRNQFTPLKREKNSHFHGMLIRRETRRLKIVRKSPAAFFFVFSSHRQIVGTGNDGSTYNELTSYAAWKFCMIDPHTYLTPKT